MYLQQAASVFLKKILCFIPVTPFFLFSQLCGCQCPQVFLRDVAGDNRTGFLTRERWLANCYPLTGVCAWLWEANAAAICSPWRNPSSKIMTFAEIFRDLTTLLKHRSWAPEEPDKNVHLTCWKQSFCACFQHHFCRFWVGFLCTELPITRNCTDKADPGSRWMLSPLGFKTYSPWRN